MAVQQRSIEYTHDGVALRGTLYFDDALGARPGVLVAHTWAGRVAFEEAKAKQLAEEGYVGFAIDMYGDGKSYGRYLYSTRHVYGEAFKLWSRETVVDDDYTMVCAWQFLESQKEKYITFGVLRFEPGENVLTASYVD